MARPNHFYTYFQWFLMNFIVFLTIVGKRLFHGVGWADASLGVALVGRASRWVAASFRTCGFSPGESQHFE